MQIESEYLELAIPNLFPHNILIVLTTKPYCSSKPNICSMMQRVLDLRRLVAYNHKMYRPPFLSNRHPLTITGSPQDCTPHSLLQILKPHQYFGQSTEVPWAKYRSTSG